MTSDMCGIEPPFQGSEILCDLYPGRRCALPRAGLGRAFSAPEASKVSIATVRYGVVMGLPLSAVEDVKLSNSFADDCERSHTARSSLNLHIHCHYLLEPIPIGKCGFDFQLLANGNMPYRNRFLALKARPKPARGKAQRRPGLRECRSDRALKGRSTGQRLSRPTPPSPGQNANPGAYHF